MVIEVDKIEGIFSIFKGDDGIVLMKEEFLDLYRQMTRMLVDEVVEEYDPDKPRPGFGHSEPHKLKASSE